MDKFYNVLVALLFCSIGVFGQENTVGVTFNSAEAFQGYTLFSPFANKLIYLIDNEGKVVNQWESQYGTGHSVYLDEEGFLYRAGNVPGQGFSFGGAGGIIEKFDWDGNRIWYFDYVDDQVMQHHDFQVLPNGNILILAWELISGEEARAQGRDPQLLSEDRLLPEHIIEIEPDYNQGFGGNIVWKWRAWDHIVQEFDNNKPNYGVVSEHPERIHLNYIKRDIADWLHANAITYNTQLDQIMISAHSFDEIWIIDHSPSTAEAAGPAGDLLFRWGNPRAYNQGDKEDQLLFSQHNPQWVPSGFPDENKIIVFNNGNGRIGEQYSAVVKIDPVVDGLGKYVMGNNARFLPEGFDYEYTAANKKDFYAPFISGTQQLPNGNILVADGAGGAMFELNATDEEVWRYENPVSGRGILQQGDSSVRNGTPDNRFFRATRYAMDFPGFEGKDLTPGKVIELPREVVLGISEKKPWSVYPNPSSTSITIEANFDVKEVAVYAQMGQLVYHGNNTSIDVAHYEQGIYWLVVNKQFRKKILVK